MATPFSLDCVYYTLFALQNQLIRQTIYKFFYLSGWDAKRRKKEYNGGQHERKKGTEMKLRLMAEITDEKGRKVISPVEIEREIPDIEAFGDSTKFYEVFDEYERPALEARTQLMEELTKEYLEQAALKKGGSSTKLRDRS